MAAKSAHLKNAVKVIVIDTLQCRLDMAKKVAECETILWNNGATEVIAEGRGAELCIDAVGFEPDRSVVDRAKAVGILKKGP